jgi:FAD/FMN-containing dehydrogenase
MVFDSAPSLDSVAEPFGYEVKPAREYMMTPDKPTPKLDLKSRMLSTEERYDSSGNPIPLEDIHPIAPTTTPITYINPNNHDEQTEDRVEVRVHTAEVASAIRWAYLENWGAMMVGERSSGVGLFSPNGIGNKNKLGMKMNAITTGDQLAKFVTIEEDAQGNPVALRGIPTSATVDAIKEFLGNTRYRINFDITTSGSSQVGANFLTGGLGDSRKSLPVIGATMVDGDGTVRNVTDINEINGYKGTQGLAGVVTELDLKIERAPLEDGMVVIPLKGETAEQAYGDSYPELVAQIWEHMHFRKMDDVWVEGAEVIDKTGLDTILRHSDNEAAKAFRDDVLGTEHHGAVILKVRFENMQDEAVNNFYMTLATLQEQGVIGDFDFETKKPKIQALEALRHSVPEAGRDEGKLPENASKSTDIDVVILPQNVESQKAIEAVRVHMRSASSEILKIACIDPLRRATKLNLLHFINGHLKFVGDENDTPMDGGGNVHGRTTGPDHRKSEIQAVPEKTARDLIAKFGKGVIFGDPNGPHVKVEVREGEKHKPNDQVALDHAFQGNPKQMAMRLRLIQERGMHTLAYRTPQALHNLMAQLAKAA